MKHLKMINLLMADSVATDASTSYTIIIYYKMILFSATTFCHPLRYKNETF